MLATAFIVYGKLLKCNREYYSLKTGIVFISVLVYTIAAYKYKYRQCNELSDVNESYHYRIY